MASFTDNLQYLTQHTPYVQQNPVEEMATVGRMKQQQYDQGIQRVQGEIDKVAGIDIARDIDKQYLQSKLNTLQGDLKKVAAGDFSNYQLQNSVGGMINGIAKDKIIQNAAYSTANYRKQLDKMQKDVDEGKSNPANIDYFNKHASTWINSPKAGEVYNGQYIPNFDVFKFAKETFDAVKPDGYSFDQIYITDQEGNPKLDSTGRPIASPIMKRLEKEGIFPEKVRQTLNQIFADPRVDTQLSISGEYALKSHSPELLSNRILFQKDKILGELNEQLNTLNLQKNTGKNVQSQIDELQLVIDNTKVKYDDFSKLAISNPDAVRGSLYKDDVRANYTSMFGWTKSKEQTVDNPLWNANFKLNQEANRVAEFRERMDFEKSKEAFDRQYKITDLNLKAQKELNKGKIQTQAKQDTQESSESLQVLKFDTMYENAAQNYNDASSDFIYSMILKNSENDAQLEKYIRAGNSKEKSIDILLKNQAREKYLLLGIGEPDEQWLNREVSNQKTRLESEAIVAINKMSPIEKDKNSDIQDSYNTFSSAKKQFQKASEIKNEAEKRMGIEFAKILNSSNFKDIKTVSVTNPNTGEKVAITPENMHDAAIYLKGNISSIGFLNNSTLREGARNAERKLTQEGKGWLLDYVIADFGSRGDIASDEIMPEGLITSSIRNIKYSDHNPIPALSENIGKIYKSIDNANLQSALKAKSEAIKQLGFTVSPNLRLDIVSGNSEQDRDTFSEILTTAGNYTQAKQNLSPDFDYSEIENVLNNKDNAKPVELKVRKNDTTGDIIPELVFYGSNGKRVSGMTLSPEEAYSMGVDINSLYEPSDVKIIRDRMNASPLGSTSIGDPKDIGTYVSGDAYFEKQDFPNLTNSRYDVKANLFRKNGLVYPVVYVTDGITTPQPRTLPGQPDVADAVNKLLSINSQFISSIINENNAR